MCAREVPSPRALKGSIDLKSGALVLDSASPECSFVVVDAGDTRYPLQANSTSEKIRWMRTLKSVVDGGDDARVRAAWAGAKTPHVSIPVGGDGAPRARERGSAADRAARKAERKAKRDAKRGSSPHPPAAGRRAYAAAAVAVVVLLWLGGWLPFRPREAAVLDAAP